MSGVRQGKTGWRLREGKRESNKADFKLRSAETHLWIQNTSDCKAEVEYEYIHNTGLPVLTTRHATPYSANALHQREHSRVI